MYRDTEKRLFPAHVNNGWILDFPTAAMEHCHREANQVAHELARQVFVSKVFFVRG